MSDKTITVSIQQLIDEVMIDELGYIPRVGERSERLYSEMESEIRKQIKYTLENVMEDKVEIRRIAKAVSKKFGI